MKVRGSGFQPTRGTPLLGDIPLMRRSALFATRHTISGRGLAYRAAQALIVVAVVVVAVAMMMLLAASEGL
jgi:hypothetical protein